MVNYYNRYSHSFSQTGKLVIFIGFALIAYMLYALTIKIYGNYQIDQHIKTFSEKNVALIGENSKKLEDYQYYTSDAYREKVAKQSLGLINSKEEVIVIADNSNTSKSEFQARAEQNLKDKENRSNPIKWWDFFFEENPYK